jgi:hypothetical protein
MVLLTANLLSIEGQSALKILTCEKVISRYWSLFSDNFVTCFMDSTTSINSDDFEVSPKDETVEGMWMNGNINIEFLPENLNKMFKNLLRYSASNCSIKQISYKKFEGLIRLEKLYLSDNQIKTIPSDTFKDLRALEELNLSENFFSLIFCFIY